MISLISYSINRGCIHSKVEKYEEADLKSENVSHSNLFLKKEEPRFS